MKQSVMAILVAGTTFLAGNSGFATSPGQPYDRYCQSTNDNYRIWLTLDINYPEAELEHFAIERRGLFGGRVVRVLRDKASLRGAVALASLNVGNHYTFSGRNQWAWTVEYDGRNTARIYANGQYMGVAVCR